MCRFYCCCYGRVYGFIIFYYFYVSKFVRLYHDCYDIFVNLQLKYRLKQRHTGKTSTLTTSLYANKLSLKIRA